MKSSSILITLIFLTTSIISCEKNDLDPTLPSSLLRGKKITYHFESGFSYKSFQYDDTGKLTSMISVVNYTDQGTFESTYNFIYGGHILKETRSLDVPLGSLEYQYGTNGQISNTFVILNEKLKEYYEFFYNTNGDLVREVIWNNVLDEDKFMPASESKFLYDERRNLTEILQFQDYGEGFKLVTTISYHDYDDKVNSEYMFMSNLYHPFVRFHKNNPRVVRVAHENGSISEQKYLYEYNSQGHVTKRHIENNLTSIDFEYQEVIQP